ncbi:nSTAND1 domain-containing NTPase [Vacuolonema iberomarrocanum]|uniref:nSTAND1 domain-containing NTPase n=1 Tax=Vacuolonema iberomarrocanum TaxID=3454632 RepID=UPI001A014107|nr:pentapeptide repeat-containing protein [filamentous cyanobacterium LEGE 07170]
MSRDALVVGINTYTHLPSLNASANDAEAIAQHLETHGNFQVKRLPQYTDAFQGNAQRVASNREVSLAQLRQALVDLFKPGSTQVPETALLYFSGHGIRDTVGVAEGYLATSDVNPRQEFFGLSLRWLRRLLAESEVRQQVIWLDCCYSGEILNMAEAYPGEGRDRCFIAASRDFEVAYEEVGGARSVMTAALLEGLQPGRYGDRPINNTLLTDYINEALKGTNQRSVCYNSGSPILLTSPWVDQTPVIPTGELTDDCPYKGLSFFDCNDHDPQYFFGRQSLVDKLIDEVRQSNFVAIVGASGSGKSSVLRAGLLHQLKLGQRLRGSEAWDIRLLLPGEHPLQNLAQVFVDECAIRTDLDQQDQLQKAERMIADGAEGLRRWVQASDTPRLVLVIDQFEEVFTLCQQPAERERFFAMLMEALVALPTQLCLVIAMRADFVGKCFEQAYSGLAAQVQAHLVPVIPMTRDELTEAICEPARRAHLTLEAELVQQLLTDVERSPGNLPLLQYTLTELWKQRQDNTLQLRTYAQLGGVTGTLEQRADTVYASLTPRQQATTRHIFINLTQLGEGTEDTRRRVLQSSLVNPKHPEATVAIAIKRLADENLIVTNELVSKATGERQAVVDVAHEALIRHWKQLRKWLDANRDLIRQQRKIETAAEEWQEHAQKPGYLLQGLPLIEARQFQQKYADEFPLSLLATQFIHKSRRYRHINHLKTASWLLIPVLLIGGVIEYQIREQGVNNDYGRLNSTIIHERSKAIQDLVRGCWAKQWWFPSYVAERLLGNCRSLARATLDRADLRAADLRAADLRSVDFSVADLHSTDLRYADLRYASLRYASLRYADLRYADLRAATFRAATLRSAKLRSADLHDAIFLSTNLQNVIGLTDRQLEGALLCNAQLPENITFDANRDCDRLPLVLFERYPDQFETLEEAEVFVDNATSSSSTPPSSQHSPTETPQPSPPSPPSGTPPGAQPSPASTLSVPPGAQPSPPSPPLAPSPPSSVPPSQPLRPPNMDIPPGAQPSPPSPLPDTPPLMSPPNMDIPPGAQPSPPSPPSSQYTPPSPPPAMPRRPAAGTR